MEMSKDIFIIDDERLSIQASERILKMKTAGAVASENSEYEGIDKAKVEQSDAIILDMMMPGLDGLTTLSYLRSHQETQHILVIPFTPLVKSIQPSPATTTRAVVMEKSFNPSTLAQQIQIFWAEIDIKSVFCKG